MTTAAQTFAEWGLGLTLDDIPASAQRAAKRHLLDGLGCMWAGQRSGEVPYARALAVDLDAISDAGLPITGPMMSGFAFALGVRMHALDYDDTHADALVHATSVVAPALVAMGISLPDVPGSVALAAAVAGYEMVCRLGAAVRHGFHARGLHATSACGVFSSALVTSRLLSLDVPTTVNALGIAGSFSSGSLEFLATGASTKQIHPGWASHAGVSAAILAAEGAQGPASILEGEYGVFRSLADTTVTAHQLTEGLGSRWEVERMTIKPYPACQLSHASLDALRAAEVPDPGAVDTIAFEVPQDAIDIVCEPADTKIAPRTSYDAKFSLPYCAAALLHDGKLGIDSFTPEAIARDDVLATARRVRATAVDPGVAAADAPGRATVTLTDGRSLTGEVKQSRGGPADPLSDVELLTKFLDNGGTKAHAEKILNLEHLDAVGALFT